MIVPEFSIGDDVLPESGARGTVLEVRPLDGGEIVYGVEDNNGSVKYYTQRALRRV
ncbi:hypothetical protein [Microbacterium sp.]|uniref:hypothetical protein n=1 Tax=Microbacterium sp. TaxID=51671 RepID=UPI00262C1302|nr:hypothetical protein [Microbacterium sp.]MCV0334078.1 hypothetical protein [Microbacterium sp.]MCV0374394.1 hypothetical protein [Microbacterium sp.]MCV0389466.1 hypothetical protein [Microbacterium sp.]MCV0419000.1 hypothetical protein [Microbacterium sp.]MCV0421306.1 hypothetical protein [Microbacterium sp.]